MSYDYGGPSVFGYETDVLRRVASISVHTSPLATLGGKDAGGMNVYVRELSCHTAKLGVPVDIFTRRTDPETPETLSICEGVNLVTVAAGPPSMVDKNALFELLPSFSREMALYSMRSGNRYDVVHAHYWLSGWTAELLKKYWETPYALTFHTTAHMKNAVSPAAEHETPLRAQIEKELIGKADSLIAANPDERADLIWRQHAASNRICTIPPGVDTELFQPLPSEDCRAELGMPMNVPIVLFVGRIDPIKGIDTLIDAFAMTLTECPDARLVIVGGDLDDDGRPTGPLATLEQRLRTKGIDQSAMLVGSQPQNRLPIFYSAADVVSVPSRYESFGLVAVEAMACGTPVVASRAGGLRFTVEDGRTGFLAPIGDSSKHANALIRLLSDPSLRSTLGSAAHISAQRFAWPVVATSVMHVYWRLAAGHRGDLCCEEEIYA